MRMRYISYEWDMSHLTTVTHLDQTCEYMTWLTHMWHNTSLHHDSIASVWFEYRHSPPSDLQSYIQMRMSHVGNMHASCVTHLNTRVRMDEWVMAHVMDCVTYEWVMSCMSESCLITVISHIWVSHCVICVSHVTSDWAFSDTNKKTLTLLCLFSIVILFLSTLFFYP